MFDICGRFMNLLGHKAALSANSYSYSESGKISVTACLSYI